tara:strand:- start:57257 stop:58246 length:990 start_codon:yes stop_codon:yes gene_type:complete
MNKLTQYKYRINLSKNRKKVWLISIIALLISILGFIFSIKNPSIKAPLLPGIDFTGGTQIMLERDCNKGECSYIESDNILTTIKNLNSNLNNDKLPSLAKAKIRFLDEQKILVLKMPFLEASEGKLVINKIVNKYGPIIKDGISVDTIGPTLGKQLLKSSLLSLLVAFTGIAIYISFRFDRKYAFLALLALAHDVIIVCGIFSWLGIIYQVEIDSLFAVALLTIAGYSVNDTVVVFDRIREIKKEDNLSNSEQVDIAVSATLTRTLYTSGTTLLPLLALILYGGSTLYWFAIALALGVIIGSWSSIALAPSLLNLSNKYNNILNKSSDL